MTRALRTPRALLPLGLALAFSLSCADAPDAGMIAGPARAAHHTAHNLESDIDALINQFFAGGNHTVVTARWRNVKRQNLKNQSGRIQHVQLVDWILRKSPELVNVPAGETREHAAGRLVLLMSAYVYGIPAEDIPEISPTTDATVAIVQPSQPDTVVTPAVQAGAVFPAGAVTEPTIIVIARVDTFYARRCSGPLDTPRCQYPEFYKFSAFPDQKFAKAVTVSVCHVNDGSHAPLADHDRFRLAHERPPAGHEMPGGTVEGNIEILPYVETGNLLACEEDHEYDGGHSHASGPLGRAGSALAMAARKAIGFFAPKPLYARRIDRGGGGELMDFSHVVTVDPMSEADLAVASSPAFSVSPNTDVPRLGSVTVSSWAVANIGSQTAGPTGVTLVMATDSALTNAVWTSGTSTIPFIDPATTSPVGAFNVVIPEHTAPGTYFIGALIDAANTVVESNESNNYISARVTVRGNDAAAVFCPAPAAPPTTSQPVYGSMSQAMANTSAGGTISVCDGEHVVSDTIKVRKPLTFRSLSPGGATLRDTYEGAFNQIAMPIFFIDSVPEGLVRFVDLGFSVQGNGIKAQFLYDSIVVDSSRFFGRTNETGIGVFIHHDNALVGGLTEVRASEFDMMSIGIFAVGNGATNVRHSNFDRFSSSGGVVYSNSSGHGVVQNNVFTRCATTGCIRILNGGNVLVQGNTLTMVDRPIGLGAITVGLNLAGPQQPVIIEDNVITSAPSTATASGFLANNGIHFTNGAAGVMHVVRRNTITAAEAGIRTPLDLNAHDNTVANGRWAFALTGLRAVNVNRNDFTGLLESFTSPSHTAHDFKCNWWGSTAGPTNPPTSVSSTTWTPYSTVPIANQPNVACPPPSIL